MQVVNAIRAQQYQLLDCFPRCHRTAPLPPKLEDLQAWSTLFRHEGTFDNYLGYVRKACLLCRVPVDVLSDPAVAKAKEPIRKRGLFAKRPRLWLRRNQVMQVVTWCEQHKQYKRYGVLYLLTYAFLLRLPSEAVPMTAGRDTGKQAVLYLVGETFVLELLRRKNKPCGSRLVHSCWCRESKVR